MRKRKTLIREMKICLPFYKMGYALCFIIFLALIRGVGITGEVGPALEPFLAMLSAVFCADTYVREIVSRRGELWHLYPIKRRFAVLMERVAVQEMFLFCLALLGYGVSFWFHKPSPGYGVSLEPEKEAVLLLLYLFAAGTAMVFWGMFSFTLSCIFRNMWAGIAGSVILWVSTNSQAGNKYLGKWNLFSYAFSDIMDMGDLGWMCGKLLCVGMSLAMLFLLPEIIKKRG